MTIADLMMLLNLDFKDDASPKASEAAKQIEKSLRKINIQGAITGDPFSKTYKYFDTFRSKFKSLSTSIGKGLELDIKGESLFGTTKFIKNIEEVHSKFATFGEDLKAFTISSKKAASAFSELGAQNTDIDRVQKTLIESAVVTSEFKDKLLALRLPPELFNELKTKLIPSLDEMYKALMRGEIQSKESFNKAREAVTKFFEETKLGSKIAVVGLANLREEYDLLNKKAAQFYKTRAITATPTKDLTGAYANLLTTIGKTRAALSNTLGMLKSEFEFIPRAADAVRSKILSLAKSGYDLSVQEVRNIKSIVKYRDVEMQALRVRSNLVRAGLASQQEVVSLIQQASQYAQKYNMNLNQVLNTLNLSARDWVSFYLSSQKSQQSLAKIQTELQVINTLIDAGISGNRAVTAEIISGLRTRQKELQIDQELIAFDKKRLVTLNQMLQYYDLMVKKARLSLGTQLEDDLKNAVRAIAEVNTQLESQYNVEANLSELRKVITQSYTKDLDISKLLEATGITREKIEQSINIAREQSLRSLELQYKLGLLNSQSQIKLRDELLKQTSLTTEQQIILGKINTQLNTEKSAYTQLIAEQQNLNTLLAAQTKYVGTLTTGGAVKEEIANAERALELIRERKIVVDETVASVTELGSLSDRNVRMVEKEVLARYESKKVLDAITVDKMSSLTADISQLKTVAELRARERDILKVLQAITKYISSNGKLTEVWKERTQVLEKALGRVRVNLRKTEAATSGLSSSMAGASSILRGFFNIRLVGVFMLYRTMWELRRVFSDVTKTLIEVEDKMKKFQSITLATNDAVATASSTVFSLSKQYALAATDLSDALIKIGQAGFTAQESIALIGNVSSLAVATGSELADTVNLMLSTMSAWTLETTKSVDVANVFTSAINSTRLTIDKLNTAFNYITGIAPQMNITIEETAAILGTMADAGIRASTSGTSFRAMMAELTKPSKRVIDMLRSLGLTIEDVDPQLNNLTDILITLKNAGFTAADAFRAFGRRGASGIAVLVANADKVAKLSTSFNNYSRAVSLAAIASEALQARLTKFWNAFKADFAGIVPFITHIIDVFSGLRTIEFDEKGALRFTKSIGELVLASQSANKRIQDLTLSMRKFNDVVGEVRGLQIAGQFVQALKKAYQAGFVNLDKYIALIKEYNTALIRNVDTTKIVIKIQKELNSSVEENIKLETLRRILEYINALEKQAKAEQELKKIYSEQNKVLIEIITNYQKLRQTLSDQPSEVVFDLDSANIEQAIATVQKLLGTPMADDWLKSLEDQNTRITGLTKETSKRLYEFITVVKLAGAEFAKRFVESGKSLDDYVKSLKNAMDVIAKGKKLGSLSPIDIKNLKELIKAPNLFRKIAVEAIKTSANVELLKDTLEALQKGGVIPKEALKDFVKYLGTAKAKTSALNTALKVLKQTYADSDKTITSVTNNYLNLITSLLRIKNATLKYTQTVERLRFAQKLLRQETTAEDYTKQLNFFKQRQKLQEDAIKVSQQAQIFGVSSAEAQERLRILKESYGRQLKLAVGNVQAINELNRWRKEQELIIYEDLGKAAKKYKGIIERSVASEGSALLSLYNQLAKINDQIKQNAVDSETAISDFDRAVKNKLNKVKGIATSTKQILDDQLRAVSDLVTKAFIATGKFEQKAYFDQAQKRLDSLKSMFLATDKLSEGQISDYARRIRNLMETMQTIRDDQLEDDKTAIQNQIKLIEESLTKLAGEMTKVTGILTKVFSGKATLKLEDNIEEEIVPKFEKLLKRINRAKPKLEIKHNLKDVNKELERTSTLLSEIKRKSDSITLPTGTLAGGGGHSTGAFIPGYGGGDIIPAWLEPGEVVIRKEIVRNLGLSFFKELNMGKLSTPEIPRYKLGGYVEPKARDIVNVNFNFGSKQFPLFGKRDVVNALVGQLKEEELMTI